MSGFDRERFFGEGDAVRHEVIVVRGEAWVPGVFGTRGDVDRDVDAASDGIAGHFGGAESYYSFK